MADGRPADLPLQLGDLRAVRSGDLVTVSLPGWIELKCNQRSDVCALEISRELRSHAWEEELSGGSRHFRPNFDKMSTFSSNSKCNRVYHKLFAMTSYNIIYSAQILVLVLLTSSRYEPCRDCDLTCL